MKTPPPAVKRLCSEIQLFDLCDRETCSCRDGRFCTDPALLARFEALSEPDDRLQDQYLDDDMDELVEGDELDYEDDFDGEEYDEE